MSLTKFDKCNSAHENALQYCCFKSNKVFCQSCWFREGHPYKCFSTKCGHFEKLAHSTIEKALQIKAMQYGSQMCSSYENFDNFYRCFYRFKETVTQKIKSDVENKLPLFIWTAITEMLKLKNPNMGNLQFQEMTCLEMLKVLRGGDQNRVKSLEEVVRNFEKLNYMHQGVQNKLKGKTYSGTLDKEIEGILTVCAQESSSLIQNLRTSMKKHMQLQISKLLKTYNPTLQFDGIKFHHKKTFQTLQHYTPQSLHSLLLHPELPSVPTNYLNFDLDLEKLEQSPEMLLEISKSILKERIYRIHGEIGEMKSSYPFKYGYLVCTTLEADPEYQVCVVGLEKASLRAFQKKNQYSFLNSINIVIMGPELITIEFKIYPRKTVEISIFGYKQARQKHCNDLIELCIGPPKDKAQPRKLNKYKFESQLSLAELAYVQFQLAYEHLFTDRESRGDFEGEKYVLGRGIKLMQEIVAGFRNTATIDFPIEKAEQDYIPLFI